MAFARAGLRFVGLLGLLFLGLAILFVLFPLWSQAQRTRMIRRWSRWLLALAGIRLQVSGIAEHELPEAALFAANHISWLDIFVINAQRASRFVAKSDIRSWPLAGTLCARSGTIFVERTKRHAVREVLHTMTHALQSKQTVAVFPEGTTSDMFELHRFHANLFQAAVVAQVPVVPIAIQYKSLNGQVAMPVQFIGDTSFVESAWRIFCEPGTIACLMIGVPIVQPDASRHDLCEKAESSVQSMFASLNSL